MTKLKQWVNLHIQQPTHYLNLFVQLCRSQLINLLRNSAYPHIEKSPLMDPILSREIEGLWGNSFSSRNRSRCCICHCTQGTVVVPNAKIWLRFITGCCHMFFTLCVETERIIIKSKSCTIKVIESKTACSLYFNYFRCLCGYVGGQELQSMEITQH